jgi:hypothetical protein
MGKKGSQGVRDHFIMLPVFSSTCSRSTINYLITSTLPPPKFENQKYFIETTPSLKNEWNEGPTETKNMEFS